VTYRGQSARRGVPAYRSDTPTSEAIRPHKTSFVATRRTG
jgi:hypothetical protein